MLIISTPRLRTFVTLVLIMVNLPLIEPELGVADEVSKPVVERIDLSVKEAFSEIEPDGGRFDGDSARHTLSLRRLTWCVGPGSCCLSRFRLFV
jgi:hypothetical protein